MCNEGCARLSEYGGDVGLRRRIFFQSSTSAAHIRYGFVDAFNPLTGWVDPDVIGIDLGITTLMAENQRTGFVWTTFMANPEAQSALLAVQLQ